MSISKPIIALGTALALSAFVARTGTAPHDPCKVLTAEEFSKIMGYAATVDKTGSTATSCFYTGPAHSGGQFMILTEAASGPHADAMLTRRGSTPPPGSGLIGGTYKQGTVIFSVSIRSTDQAKLQALVAEIRHNLG
jgi:hypothetical protein